jgi:hypothetical protein
MERARFDELSHYEPYPSKTSMWKLTMDFNGPMEAQLDHPPFSANVIDAQLHPLARYSASYDGRLDCQSSMVCSGGIKFAALNHG